MSKYTTEVRFICETAAGYNQSQGYKKIDEIIGDSLNSVFDFDFPMFDESYRTVLETKILRHYYTREIGLETVGLWKHFMQMRLNEIMPYYNKLYNSELLEFNPLYNVNYDTTHKGKSNGASTTTNSGSIGEDISDRANRILSEDISDDRSSERDWDDTSMDKFSDTPQGAVTNLANGTYLTNARQIVRSGNDDVDEDYTRDRDVSEANTMVRDRDVTTRDNGSGSFNNTDEYLRHVEGNNGSRTFSELLQQFRETFLNIDMMIINDLNDLFMGVW